ncbi:hypothetical protein TNCV_2636061 [Trichonephila clavipes]|nr:hypothetical protein TNCV_2636061 [Trichonephila clavipes]
MDIVILKHGQMTRATPELAPPLLTTTPHQREDISALDIFNVHRGPHTAGLLRHWARNSRHANHDSDTYDQLIPRPQVRSHKSPQVVEVEKRESAALISSHLINLYEI